MSSAVFYGVGWDAAEFVRHPQPPAIHVSSTWIHTGIQWVALPDPVYRVWVSARHQPVPYATIRSVIARVFPEDANRAWATWWRSRVWLAWPWTLDPYGASEADQLTLVSHGPAPCAVVDEGVWQAHPSLAQLLGILSHSRNAPEQIAGLCRDSQAHWLVGRRGLPGMRGYNGSPDPSTVA